MNHIRQHRGATFVPLPEKLRRDIEWGCDCKFCKAHPDRKPQWDALGITIDNPQETWVVHFPELRAAKLADGEWKNWEA